MSSLFIYDDIYAEKAKKRGKKAEQSLVRSWMEQPGGL